MSVFLRELYCGLTNDHIVKEPISLICGGHCICKHCVPDEAKIKCKICNTETNKSKLEITTESVLVKRMIKSSLSSLYEELEKRTTNEINSFKSLLEIRESTLEAHLKCLEEEIEIRIESIKINLDELFQTFKKDLSEIKREIIEIQTEAFEGRTDTNELENNLKELRDYIKNNETKTEEKFYEHQENFEKINKMIENFQYALYNSKLDFKQSKDKVDKKLIGEIVFGGLSAYKMNKMKRVLMNGKIETIQLATNGVSLIPLPNGNLVYSTSGKVFLLNENFQEIKSVETGGLSCCALNQRNEIYVSVANNKHCIILFDLNLNQLQKFGSLGHKNNQFTCPLGLCCHGDYLYICDCNNHRIQILTLNFEYSSTIQLDGLYPYSVQISNTTIGVCCEHATLFYDLQTRALKYKHNFAQTYIINYIDSIFCTLNVKQKKIYFFNSDGNVFEEKAFHEKLILSNSWSSGSMCTFKDQLYMTDHSSGTIFKFV